MGGRCDDNQSIGADKNDGDQLRPKYSPIGTKKSPSVLQRTYGEN